MIKRKFNWVQRYFESSKEHKLALKLRRMAKQLYKLHKKYGAQYTDVSIVPSGAMLTLRANDCYVIQDFSKLPEGK